MARDFRLDGRAFVDTAISPLHLFVTSRSQVQQRSSFFDDNIKSGQGNGFPDFLLRVQLDDFCLTAVFFIINSTVGQ
jgi:hypothetical protein